MALEEIHIARLACLLHLSAGERGGTISGQHFEKALLLVRAERRHYARLMMSKDQGPASARRDLVMEYFRMQQRLYLDKWKYVGLRWVSRGEFKNRRPFKWWLTESRDDVIDELVGLKQLRKRKRGLQTSYALTKHEWEVIRNA